MKLKDKFILYVGGLLSGGDVIINNKDELTPVTIMQQKELGSKLMQSLLKKEVTQEVAELRWRMYLLDREMDKYNVVRNTNGELKVVKIHPEFTKPTVFEEKNKKVVIVQNTEPLTSGTDNGITDNMKLHELNRIKQIYPLKFERERFTRCKFEKSCYQVVLKRSGRKNFKYHLDFYFYCTPNPYDQDKRLTTLQISKVFDKKQSIEIVDDWMSVEFTTGKYVWGTDSNIRYKFKRKKYINTYLWGSFFVVQYEVKIIEKVDEIQQYYEDTIQQKYDNKEERTDRLVKHNITGDDDVGKDEFCDVCGKLMIYKNLEVSDYRITKEVFGKGMCTKCLKNKIKNNENSN